MKLGYILAAALVAAISLPSAVSAQTTIIKKKVYRESPHSHMRMHRHHSERRHYHAPRGHRHVDRTVVIKRQRY